MDTRDELRRGLYVNEGRAWAMPTRTFVCLTCKAKGAAAAEKAVDDMDEAGRRSSYPTEAECFACAEARRGKTPVRS